MDIAAKKLELFEWLASVKDEHTIAKLYLIKDLEENNEMDWWDALPESKRTSILNAVDEVNQGKGIPHEEARKRYAKWL